MHRNRSFTSGLIFVVVTAFNTANAEDAPKPPKSEGTQAHQGASSTQLPSAGASDKPATESQSRERPNAREQEPTIKIKEKIVRGKSALPLPEKTWLASQSDEVCKLIKQRQFFRKLSEGKWVIGVVDSKGIFVTWPGSGLGMQPTAGEFHIEQGNLPVVPGPKIGGNSF